MSELTNLHTSANSAANHALAMRDVIQQYLTFMLGPEIFAVNILNIKEIIEYGQLTEVPQMPNFIRGVINLRGAVVPVIDMAARFGKASSDITRKTCVVIVEVNQDNEQYVVGMLVDAVNEVLDIPAHQVEPPPAFGANIQSNFIAGMGKVNEKFVIILNVDRVLSMDEMASLAEVNEANAH